MEIWEVWVILNWYPSTSGGCTTTLNIMGYHFYNLLTCISSFFLLFTKSGKWESCTTRSFSGRRSIWCFDLSPITFTLWFHFVVVHVNFLSIYYSLLLLLLQILIYVPLFLLSYPCHENFNSTNKLAAAHDNHDIIVVITPYSARIVPYSPLWVSACIHM